MKVKEHNNFKLIYRYDYIVKILKRRPEKDVKKFYDTARSRDKFYSFFTKYFLFDVVSADKINYELLYIFLREGKYAYFKDQVDLLVPNRVVYVNGLIHLQNKIIVSTDLTISKLKKI